MLRNELEILTMYMSPQEAGCGVFKYKKGSDFSKLVSESCGSARKAWAAAIFHDTDNEKLSRYFSFHFQVLSSLLDDLKSEEVKPELEHLCGLMDHLLSIYPKFIELNQAVSKQYVKYRRTIFASKYQLFINLINSSQIDEALKDCITSSLTPIYNPSQLESLNVEALFYRIDLINSLINLQALPVLSNDDIINTLIRMNFNNFLFYKYLRQNIIAQLNPLSNKKQKQFIIDLIAQLPAKPDGGTICFDKNWPHIVRLYKDWIVDYAALLEIYDAREGRSLLRKIPLNISVKKLGCMIRSLYESGFYGNITLTAIFDHTAAVFSSKRRECISSESLSNAYYEIDRSSAIYMARIFNNAADFLKSYYSLD